MKIGTTTYPDLPVNCFQVNTAYPRIFESCGPGSVVGIATGYGLDVPGIEYWWGGDFPHLSRLALGAHPASCTIGTGSFPGVESGGRMTLTPHHFLEPWLWKSRAIHLLPLWAVQPVESLSACTGVYFTYTWMFISISVRTSNLASWFQVHRKEG
jgi:hypothetical protein